MSEEYERHIDPPVRVPKRYYANPTRRVTEAWNLRVAGLGWREIAETVGYASASNACRAVSRYARVLPTPAPREQRTLWRARLEQFWRLAHRDAELGRAGALRAGVAIAARASALDGLDAPQRVEIDYSSPDVIRGALLALGFTPAELGTLPILEADVLELGELDAE